MEAIRTQPKDGILSWEFMLMGGASIIVCLACWAFTDKSASVLTMSQLAFALAFVMNHPHFLSSYVLLYKDFRKNIFTKPKYFWAGVVSPVLLAGYLIYCLVAGNGAWMGQAVNAMFFLVGWHYVKQIFGCVIVTSVRRKIFYSVWERRLMLFNLFAIWAVSWLRSQVGHQSFQFYGITYFGLDLPRLLQPLSLWVVGLSGLAVVYMLIRKFIADGSKPSMPGLAALGALYVWYLPAFDHPSFAYLIPFFHSLQYLVFVWSFKKNQVAAEANKHKGRDQREIWVRDFIGYAVGVTILGALSFEFVPNALDAQNWIHNPSLGTAPILSAVLLFINIHHYFIDNAIWKSNNDEMKKYLFAEPKLESVQSRSA